MSESENNDLISTAPGSFEDAAGSPQSVVVEVHMRPERILHGAEGEACAAEADARISKRYRTGSWTFAADFLEKVAGRAAHECAGLRVRPVKVAITFALDEKAYRQVGLILESFDDAYRGH